MRIAVYEHVTGGGMADYRDRPPSWVLEGKAIRCAIANDFASVPGIDVTVAADARDVPATSKDNDDSSAIVIHPFKAGDLKGQFTQLVKAVDAVVLIAPETERILETLRGWLDEAGGLGLGPDRTAIALTADKLRLAQHLEARRIPTPTTVPFVDDRQRIPSPRIIKPRFGAGTLDTFLETNHMIDRPITSESLIQQPFVSGQTCSITAIGSGHRGDPPRIVGWASQRVTCSETTLRYEGGAVPLLIPNGSALTTALGAIESVDGLRGLFGLDTIIDPETGDLTVLEINPRPTTSIVAWTAWHGPGVVATAWLEAVIPGWVRPKGIPPLDPARTDRPAITFEPDGTLRSLHIDHRVGNQQPSSWNRSSFSSSPD